MCRMARCTWPIAAVLLKVFVAGEVRDRWPHVNALSALSARLAAAESEVNATQTAMAHCAAELRAERDALAKTRATVASSEKDVLKGKDELRQAEARRQELRGKMNKDSPVPATLQSEELEAISIFTQRVQQETQELTDAKAKLAAQIAALKSRGGNKHSEVQAVKTELERIENRTQVWEADKHALSEALAANNRSALQRLPTERELNELSDLEQVVIPSVTSSITAQEEIVASVMATLNASRYQLRACLESDKSSKQSVAPTATKASSDKTLKKMVPQAVKQQTSQPVDDGETSAEKAAASDLDHILKSSTKDTDAKREEQDIEADLHAELSDDEPYQPLITAKSIQTKFNASNTGSSQKPSGIKTDEKVQNKKVEKPHAPDTASSVKGIAGATTHLNAANKSTMSSHVVKKHNASQSSSVEALKAALAAPRKMAESLRGKLQHSSPTGNMPHVPSFGEQLAGLLR